MFEDRACKPPRETPPWAPPLLSPACSAGTEAAFLASSPGLLPSQEAGENEVCISVFLLLLGGGASRPCEVPTADFRLSEENRETTQELLASSEAVGETSLLPQQPEGLSS